ncbi:MAG: ligand-binding sensor domain-containing protein [Ignavibacteria bacterium]
MTYINKGYCVIILIVFLAGINCYAEDINSIKYAKFDKYTIDDGLSFDNSRCIVTDKLGFLWVGTYDGLNRYDGINFKVFRNDPTDSNSVIGNSIGCMICDSKGILWIGTNNGLCYFDYNYGKFVKINNSINDTLESDFKWIFCLYEDKENNIWFGNNEGLNVYNPVNKTLKKYEIKTGNNLRWEPLNCIYEDSKNDFWVATFAGLLKFNKNTGEFINYFKTSNDNKLNSIKYVTCLFEDSKNNFWVGTWGGGLNKFNRETGEYKSYLFDNNVKETDIGSTNIVNFIYEEKNSSNESKLWVVGEGLGIAIFDAAKEKFHITESNPYKYKSLPTKSVRYVADDKQGNLWFASGYGLFRYSSLENRFKCIKLAEEINDKNRFQFNGAVSYINKGENSVWMSCWGEGLFKWNRSNNSFKKINPKTELKNNWVNCIFRNDDGKLWIGHSKGIEIYNPLNNSLQNLDLGSTDYDSIMISNIFDIIKDNSGVLWVSASKGLLSYNPVNKLVNVYTKSNSGLNDYRVNKLFSSKNGEIWVCTNNQGLFKLDNVRKDFKNYKHNPADSNSIPSNQVLNITEDSFGILWVGSSNGLTSFNPVSNVFKNYSTKDGLMNSIVYSVIIDKLNRVWAITGNGISVYEQELNAFLSLNSKNGLHENYSSVFSVLPGGEFLIGYDGYVDLFTPESIQRNKYVPNTEITSFSVFDNEVKLLRNNNAIEPVNVTYLENSININYITLNFFNEKRCNYSYKLEGFDKNWIPAGIKRNAVYTNLDPGKYTFYVKGSNNDGVMNEKSVSLTFIISPPFWKIWWFRTLVFMLIVSIILIVIRRKISSINKAKLEQEDFTRQLIDSQENERKRIASELHDSLGQNLLIIKNKAILAVKSNDLDKTSREKIEEISELTSQTLSEVRSISYNLRPYEIDRLGLTEALNSLIENLSLATLIKADYVIENIDNIFESNFEINIYRIVQEILNNIIKHSGADKLTFVIKKEPKIVMLTVSDNGKGYNSEGLQKDKSSTGSGIKSIDERTKMMKGSFAISSNPGKGTEILIKIPY